MIAIDIDPVKKIVRKLAQHIRGTTAMNLHLIPAYLRIEPGADGRIVPVHFSLAVFGQATVPGVFIDGRWLMLPGVD
jgi:hypothetical protein